MILSLVNTLSYICIIFQANLLRFYTHNACFSDHVLGKFDEEKRNNRLTFVASVIVGFMLCLVMVVKLTVDLNMK